MAKTLYIIGNGFDKYHGLATGYSDFRCYMMQNHHDEWKRIGLIFNRKNPDQLWSNFEKELETFDALKLVKKNVESWMNLTLNEFENQFDVFHNAILGYFHEWILQIDMNKENKKRLELDKNALFLSFNYTNTLEKLYGISSNQICYIHGNTLNSNSLRPIVGHSHKHNCVAKVQNEIRQYIKTLDKCPKWAVNFDDFADIVLEELNKFWDGLAKEPCSLQIDPHKKYTIIQNGNGFKDYNKLDDIYVMGHSLEYVDADYFKEIYSLSPNAEWHISKYNEKEDDLKQKLSNLLQSQVSSLRISIFTMDSLAINK